MPVDSDSDGYADIEEEEEEEEEEEDDEQKSTTATDMGLD